MSLRLFLRLLAFGWLWASSLGAVDVGLRRYDLGEGRYALRYFPASLELATPPFPLIVFLHGSGSSPEAWQSTLVAHAEELGFVLLMPHSASDLGFGPGDDLATLAAARMALAADYPIDPRRQALAGHSSGGAFALYLAHESVGTWSAVFALGAPYRIVATSGETLYKPPTRLSYGALDPNFIGGSFAAWHEQLLRLGGLLEIETLAGVGHGGYPASTYAAGFGFLLAKSRPPEPTPTGPCVTNAETLCLHDGRFAVSVAWRTAQSQGNGKVSSAKTAESGLFWFFSENNWELQVKVLDGCALNQRFWVYTAGSTDVGYTLTIKDLVGDAMVVYDNRLGQLAGTVADVTALATCD
jgi:hypothetical protein